MTIVVTEAGFRPDDWTAPILPFAALWDGQDLPDGALAVDFPPDRSPEDLQPWLDRLALVRVQFPAMGDGRGFSIARRLRAMGYRGRLRAEGPLVADQFAAARRSGFDEVALAPDVARRQPPEQWRLRPRPSYQSRLLA